MAKTTRLTKVQIATLESAERGGHAMALRWATLRALEKRGLIAAAPGSHRLSLTDAGRAALARARGETAA